MFRSAYDALLGLGLIEVVVRGSWQQIPEFGPQAGYGKAERIRATDAFIYLVRGHGIAPGSAARHFHRLAKPKPLELRSGSFWIYGRKIPGRRLRFEEDGTTRRLRAEVEELNAFIARVRLEGAELTGWTRIFNEGDHPAFAWDRGGRLYARPQGSYQALPEAERGRLRLDGEAVVELDLRASHLTLVYARRGIPPVERFRAVDGAGNESLADPYALAGLPREVVKAWVTVTLGAGGAPERWPRGLGQRLREERNIRLRAYPVATVADAVLRRHPVLGDLSGISWGTLQFVESNAIVATMLRLKRDYAIPALPVHDNLIVPVSAWAVAGEILRQELRAATGFAPLPFDYAPPRDRLPPAYDARRVRQLRAEDF